MIQTDHDLEREQKVNQVLDTITPNDKNLSEIHFTFGTCHQEAFS